MVELPSTPPRTSSLPSHSPRRSSPRSVNLTPRKSPPKWNALTDSEAGPEQEDEVDMLVARSPSTDTYPPVALSQSMSKPDIRINDRAMDFSDVVTIDDGRGGRMSIAKDFKGMGMAEKDARRPARLDLSRASNLQPAAPLSSSTLVPPLSGASTTSSTTTPASKRTNAIQPSISLLFSLTSRSSTLFVVLPAVLMSIISGLIPPYMTELIGVAFGAFTQYAIVTSTAISDSDLAAARSTLLASTKNSSLQFVALAVMILITSTASVGLWVLNGERVVKALRTEVFLGIGAREMAWFDLGMGAGSNKEAEEGEGEREGDSAGGQGAGGLLGRFARETDNVRLAASQTIGLIIQYFTSFLACLVLSFYRDALLTVVILASIPAVILIVAVTEKLAAGYVTSDRDYAAKSAGRADRILGAIPTIKAFNAQEKEMKEFESITSNAYVAYSKLHFIWGIRGGATQFILLSMFVQGFWFGSYLVRNGKSSAGAVNTCFWACLLAATYLQLCVPSLVILEKGKMGMADLLELARANEVEDIVPDAQDTATLASPMMSNSRDWRKGSTTSVEPFATKGVVNSTSSIDFSNVPASPMDRLPSPTFSIRTPVHIPLSSLTSSSPSASNRPLKSAQRNGKTGRRLRKLHPTEFSGELNLRNVTFYYPSRLHPAPPALKNVHLYLAAKETTYIVGGSGSGKSTVGNLLLGLYRPESGTIEVDEQGLDWIDDEWLRGHVACVSQGASVIFDGTVHDNIAIGVVGQIQPDGTRRDPKDVKREEVIEACRGALVHEFIRDLPEGYDTWLSGEKGASLSGGQRQRLAIARAWIRNPTVLILDEATSALDATSRLLVSEAVKHWRKNKTTIIITHDLTPIDAQDFVYVMTNGSVVEQGYRRDLEANTAGAFCALAGIEPEEELLDEDYFVESYTGRNLDDDDEDLPNDSQRQSGFYRVSLFPATGGVIAQSRQLAIARHASAFYTEDRQRRRSSYRPSSQYPRQSRYDTPPPVYDFASFSETNPRDSTISMSALTSAANKASSRRPGGQRIKHKTMVESDAKEWMASRRKKESEKLHTTIEIESKSSSTTKTREMMGIIAIARKYYPTIPNKMLFWFGIFCSLMVGATTPIFSSLLSKLMANLGDPNAGSLVISTSLLILLIAFIDGFGTLLKFYALERCGMGWIAALRIRTLRLILKQDKAWFDREENSASNLVNILMKDAEDARTLVGTVIGSLFVVVSMIFIGLAWAFVIGWELTLVGVGLAPVFVIATRLQASVVSKVEAKNKRMREDVSKRFHQVVSNIRAIRAMSIKSVFDTKFEESIEIAYVGGARAAPFAGFGFGVGASLTYIAEALMFYVGAILIANGRYTFAKMLEVFTLIIFSITFSAQIMTYLPAMTKSIHAAIDFSRLLDLESETNEAQGRMTFPITGHIQFENVIFAYPSRPDVPVLKGMTFEVKPGECIGVVGASGSGKSTITALLQRLYEPDFGTILLDGRPLDRIDVKYLRDHIALVSQHPTLFDMTIGDNIAYGCDPTTITTEDIIRAAKAAHVHDFIISLPKGYETFLGENAVLISGGQAQRLQLARALIRPREILILDEATSALDSTNQLAVMKTIREAKVGKTTLIVTHKLAVMEMCDRLLVVDVGGRIVETGSAKELKGKVGGVFASMARAGEWEGTS